MGDVFILDSITQLPPEAEGKIVLAASHGGAYCARLSLKAKLRGVILHDAGVGRDEAGIGGIAELDDFSVPAAAIDFRSARIGDGKDCAERGRISFANATAKSIGIEVGDGAAAALKKMQASDHQPNFAQGQDLHESRRPWEGAPAGVPVELLDSNSLVTPDDKGKIVITGSHGALLGGRPETAIKQDVFAAFYNDAGIGMDEAGISRLPSLEARGIAGVTVSAESARIGDGVATLEDGIVSAANPLAQSYGVQPGQTAKEAVAHLAKAWAAKFKA